MVEVRHDSVQYKWTTDIDIDVLSHLELFSGAEKPLEL